MDMDDKNLRSIEGQADRWFARLLAPDCSASDREEFERWRRVPEHASAWSRRQVLWDRLGSAEVATDPRVLALRERVKARAAPTGTTESLGWQQTLATMPVRKRPLETPRRRRAWPIAVAASVLLLAVTLGVRFMGAPPADRIYSTADSLREVRLEDGTRLQLDVSTELAVRFEDRSRLVTLRHGRALFDVAHDAQRPFTVDLGESRVTVLGTLFQTVRDAGNVSVTLERGSLRLDGGRPGALRSERLVPGDQVGYSAEDVSAWDKHSVDSAAVLGWSRGRLVFRAIPLSEAVLEVNRYASSKLRLADPALGDLKVSGNFIAGDGDLVASTWAATLPLRLEKHENEIVLLPENR